MMSMFFCLKMQVTMKVMMVLAVIMVTPTASMIKMSMIIMILRTIIDETHCSCHDVVVFLAVSARRSRAVGQSHGKDGGGGFFPLAWQRNRAHKRGLGSRTQLQI